MVRFIDGKSSLSHMAGRLRELSQAPFVIIPFMRVLPLYPNPFPRSPPCNIINCRLGFNRHCSAGQFNNYFSPTEVFKYFSSNVPVTGFVGL